MVSHGGTEDTGKRMDCFGELTAEGLKQSDASQ